MEIALYLYKNYKIKRIGRKNSQNVFIIHQSDHFSVFNLCVTKVGLNKIFFLCHREDAVSIGLGIGENRRECSGKGMVCNEL